METARKREGLRKVPSAAHAGGSEWTAEGRAEGDDRGQPARDPANASLRSSEAQFLRTAKALLLRRRTKEAINLLRRGLNLDPSCSEAALLMAKALVAIKRLPEACALLERLIERDGSAAAYALLCRVLIAEGDLPSAFEMAERALALHPRDTRLKELCARLKDDPGTSTISALLRGGARSPSEPKLEPEERPTTRAPEIVAAAAAAAEAEAEEQVTVEEKPTVPVLPELVIQLPTPVPEERDTNDSDTGSPVTPTLRDGSMRKPRPAPEPEPTPEPTLEPTPEPILEPVSQPTPETGTVRAPVLLVLAHSTRAPEVPPPEPLDAEVTPSTPLPSDELDFDRRPGAREEKELRRSERNSAPDLISAVKQLVPEPIARAARVRRGAERGGGGPSGARNEWSEEGRGSEARQGRTDRTSAAEPSAAASRAGHLTNDRPFAERSIDESTDAPTPRRPRHGSSSGRAKKGLRRRPTGATRVERPRSIPPDDEARVARPIVFSCGGRPATLSKPPAHAAPPAIARAARVRRGAERGGGGPSGARNEWSEEGRGSEARQGRTDRSSTAEPSAAASRAGHLTNDRPFAERPIRGELVATNSRPTPPTMPGAGRRVLLSPGQPGGSLARTRPGRRLAGRPDASKRVAPPAMRGSAKRIGASRGTIIVATIRRAASRWSLHRWWPLLLALALCGIAAGGILGLTVRRAARAREHLATARQLAAQNEPEGLRAALQYLRGAANLVGRKPEVLALAAAIHARLAVEFGESDLRGAESLLEEAMRLEAERQPASIEDVLVARAYLQLARRPLPEAINHIFKSLERQPESLPLLLLYGEALARNGEYYLAGRVLEKLPVSNGQVLRARAYLLTRQGYLSEAEGMVRTAIHYGLPAHSAELALAQFQVSSTAIPTDARLLHGLQRLARDRQLSASQQAWAHLLVAALQQAQGQRDLARASLSRALVSRPLGDVDFRVLSGRLLLELHDLDAAFREAVEGARLAPLDRRLIELSAAVELAMDRPAAVIRRLITVEELGASGRLTLAEAYLRAGQPGPSRALLARLSEEPSPRALLLGARLDLAAGRPYAVLRQLENLGRQSRELEAEAYLLRGLATLSMDDTAEASRWFRAALGRDPLQAEALLELGRLTRRQRDGRSARSHLERAVAANPHLRAARLELAQLLVQLGDFAAAQTQYEEALVLEPTSLTALLGRARAAVELGSKDSEVFLRALAVRGERLAAEVLSARLAMVRQDWRGATEQLDRLARKPGPLQTEATLWLAQSLLRHGNLAAAELAFERVGEREREQARSPAASSLGTNLSTSSVAEAHLGLSHIDLRRKHFGTALLHATAARDELGHRVHSLALRCSVKLQLARCYRRTEATGAAIAELQDILERDGQCFDAQLELGQIYASLGKRSRAVTHLTAALRLNEQSSEARQELLRLCRGRSLPGCPSAAE